MRYRSISWWFISILANFSYLHIQFSLQDHLSGRFSSLCKRHRRENCRCTPRNASFRRSRSFRTVSLHGHEWITRLHTICNYCWDSYALLVELPELSARLEISRASCVSDSSFMIRHSRMKENKHKGSQLCVVERSVGKFPVVTIVKALADSRPSLPPQPGKAFCDFND